MDKRTLNKLNALLQCNPAYCKYSNCPVFFTEVGQCDATRFIQLINLVLTTKFEDVPTYTPFANDNSNQT